MKSMTDNSSQDEVEARRNKVKEDRTKGYVIHLQLCLSLFLHTAVAGMNSLHINQKKPFGKWTVMQIFAKLLELEQQIVTLIPKIYNVKVLHYRKKTKFWFIQNLSNYDSSDGKSHGPSKLLCVLLNRCNLYFKAEWLLSLLKATSHLTIFD